MVIIYIDLDANGDNYISFQRDECNYLEAVMTYTELSSIHEELTFVRVF